MRRLILAGVILAAGIYAAVLLPQQSLQLDAVVPGGGPDSYGTAHKHLYFKAVIAGERINLSRDRFQLAAKKVHLEGGNGEIVHVHADGVTFGFFLETLDIGMNASCITMNRTFCTNRTHTVRVYVDGNVSASPQDHELEQDDNIVLWYGPRTERPDPEFFDRTLPAPYQPRVPGTRI